MTNKDKWLTVLVSFVLLLLCTGAGLGVPAGTAATVSDSDALTNADKSGTTDGDVQAADRTRTTAAVTQDRLPADILSGAALGGIAGRMPANSSKIFFESMLGRKLSAYRTYSDTAEELNALFSGEVAAIWAADVTAQYLMRTVDGLMLLDTSDMAAIENMDEPRFEFAMAARNDEDGQALAESLNQALDYLEKYGTLKNLTDEYIDGATQEVTCRESDMVIRDRLHKMYYYDSDTIRVGVTGAVPPIELIDASGEPYGFCVALMDEIGQILKTQVEFVVLDNETAFSSLMSGRVDVIFCYATGRITTEGSKSWCMTRGYFPMYRYEFLTRSAAEEK